RSDSFRPSDIGYNLHREILPDPTGQGDDYGVAFNLFDSKLIVRINRYKNLQINARNGPSGSIAQRVRRLDFIRATGAGWNLQRQATAWMTAANPGISVDQLNQQHADLMQLPLTFITEPPPNGTAVDDLVSRGTEVEVFYNPNPWWTVKLNVTEQETINAGIAAEVSEWIEERLPVWTSIIDPRTNTPWWTNTYPNGKPVDNYISLVAAPLKIAQALQGKSRTQVRKYRANLSTKYQLAGLSDHAILKRMSVGGSLRWEDKGSIGYWGVQTVPTLIEDLDPTRPIWDKSHTYVDAFATYRTKIFHDKVGLTLQFNIRNLTEDGHLQPIAVEANGIPIAYRIVEPRRFILTATFHL
ncbi:MAG: TonB-dependent receptor, partial [Burkholderiales bacterium]